MANEAAEPAPPDTKPVPIDRRSFVKRTMQIAAGGAVVAGLAPSVVPLSYNPRKIKRFPYLGARVMPRSPAPQGIPLIPVRVTDAGELEGIPENTKSQVKHSLDWYKYCSHEAATGLVLNFTDDNVLRYYTNPEKITIAGRQGIDLWYKELLDQPVRAEHFKKIGQGAPFRWRSEGQVGTNIVTGIVLKVDAGKIRGKLPEGFVHQNEDGSGFMAVCSFCAHFCCVPGYTENNSPLTKVIKADRMGDLGRELIYCSCHDSRYDPLDIREYTFPPDF